MPMPVLAALLLLYACEAGNPPVPQAQMAALLTDIHIAEVRATQVRAADSIPLTGEKNMDSLALYYREILEHHHLDTATFRKALDWYTERPVALDSVYKETVRGLELLGNEAPQPPRPQ